MNKKLKLIVIDFNTDNLCCKNGGKNKSPQIKFENNSIEPISYALIIEDPDAPINFIHWYLPYISPKISKLNSLNMNCIDQNKQSNNLTKLNNSIQSNNIKIKNGYNSLGEIGYHGPCNPQEILHRYFFRLYALNGIVDNLKISSSKDFEKYLLENNIQILDSDVIMYKYSNGGIPFLSNID